MRFHRKMVWLTIGSNIVCFAAFYLLKQKASEGERPLAMFFGWLFYYGIFAINGPLFLTAKDRTELFEPRYFWGTILLIIWNVFAPLIAMVLA